MNTEPDATATPTGEVTTTAPATVSTPEIPKSALEELQRLRAEVKSSQAAAAEAAAAKSAVEAESARRIEEVTRQSQHQIAWARVEALHPATAEPEVRGALEREYAHVAASAGDKAPTLAEWLADHAPKSRLFGHLFALPVVAAPPAAAPEPAKVSPAPVNTGAVVSPAAPPAGKMTLERYRALRDAGELKPEHFRQLAADNGIAMSTGLTEAAAERAVKRR